MVLLIIGFVCHSTFCCRLILELSDNDVFWSVSSEAFILSNSFQYFECQLLCHTLVFLLQNTLYVIDSLLTAQYLHMCKCSCTWRWCVGNFVSTSTWKTVLRSGADAVSRVFFARKTSTRFRSEKKIFWRGIFFAHLLFCFAWREVNEDIFGVQKTEALGEEQEGKDYKLTNWNVYTKYIHLTILLPYNNKFDWQI